MSQKNAISGVEFIDAHTMVTCVADTGELWLIDSRHKAQKASLIPACTTHSHNATAPNKAYWVFEMFSRDCGKSDGSKTEVIRLSSDGMIMASNLHKPGEVLWSHDTGLQPSLASDQHHLQIHVCINKILNI